MKTTILSLISFLALGFAGVAHAGEGAARRGQVNVQATAAKAVVAGPAVIKVYSGFSAPRSSSPTPPRRRTPTAWPLPAARRARRWPPTRSSSSPWARVRLPASRARARRSSSSGTRSRPRRRPRSSRSDNGRRAAAGGLRPRPQSARVRNPIEPIARRRNGRELDSIAGSSRRVLGRHSKRPVERNRGVGRGDDNLGPCALHVESRRQALRGERRASDVNKSDPPDHRGRRRRCPGAAVNPESIARPIQLRARTSAAAVSPS